MDNRIKKYPEDILLAICEIDIFFETPPKQYEAFCNNLLLRRAVARNIEIIGETTNRILKNDNTVSITNARKIVDTRNKEVKYGFMNNLLPIFMPNSE
ncbi:MAG: hypothetical protein LBB73_09780 [Dysgonamonadaceae bacterium]|jgi:uncharacterized protein with HEPN domain|nr:hypothetical protein [Dysgonamonadaceae bacterium]